jgi:hypothetical protein
MMRSAASASECATSCAGRREARRRRRLPLSVTADVPATSRSGLREADVASVTSTSSSVCRVAPSTRTAVFTVSPITVKSRRPPPPTVPAMTVPRVDSDADAELVAVAQSDGGGYRKRGVSALAPWCVRRSGRRRPSAIRHPSACWGAPVLANDRDHAVVEVIQHGNGSTGAGTLGEGVNRAGRRTGSRPQPPRRRDRRPSTAPLGKLRVDVGAERSQPLALLEPSNRLVEGPGEVADLI